VLGVWQGLNCVAAATAVAPGAPLALGKTAISKGPLPLTVGLGTCLVSDESVSSQVGTALEVGYRVFDTAQKYTNEPGVGRALRKAFGKGLSRDEVFVTTKVWPSNEGHDEVVASVQDSAERLGLEAIDLVMPHWPTGPGFETRLNWKNRTRGIEANANNRRETWRALEELQRNGFVRHIGVSNYNERHLRELLEYAEVPPAVSQFEVHPYNVRQDLVALCEQEGISVNAYSPLGGKGNPKQVTDKLLCDPVITRVAEAHGKTPAQVILRWHLERGITPIPKATARKRLEENFAVFDFKLTPAEVAEISALDRGNFVIMDSEVLL